MKIVTIVRREFLSRVRTRGFIAFTLGIPLIGAGFMWMEYAIFQASQNVTSRVAVVDLSKRLYPILVDELRTRADLNGGALQIQDVAATPQDLPSVETSLRERVLNKQVDGYLVIPVDVLTSRSAEYHALNAAALGVRQSLQDRLAEAVNRARMASAGMSAGEIAAIDGNFTVDQLKVTQSGERKDNGQSLGLVIAMAVILYVFLLLYGVVVMRAVTEEKTTRISEVLLAAVDPFSLMLGKICGVVATALTQLLVWCGCFALAGAYEAALAKTGGANVSRYLPRPPIWLFICFLIFFLAGFLLYASIYAAIGAMVSSEQEAQQTQMPLTMVLVVGFYLAFLVMSNPSSTLSVALSLFPLFAPILMVVRVAVSNPPVWQVVLAMALCVLTFIACTKATAKIYRVGILMTGKRPNLPELLRWLRYA